MAARDVPNLTVVCGYPPNNRFGGGIILRSLLEQYPRDRLTIVTSGPVLDELRRPTDAPAADLLPCRHIPVHPVRLVARGTGRLRRMLNISRIPGMARLIAGTSAGGVILAAPWGGELGSELFAASYLGHRRSHAGLIVYELDEWRASVAATNSLALKALERFFHRRLLRSASAVYAVSEQLASNLAGRSGRAVQTLPSSVDVDERVTVHRQAPDPGVGPRVLYTGAVYAAQADAIASVASAIETLGRGARLLLYTSESERSLANFGIAGAQTDVHRPVPRSEVPALLAGADILLLPASFRADQRDVVGTSMPTKTADYLASGVPILVHGPPYSTIAKLARAHGCAEIVDQPDLDSVVRALRSLAEDPDRRRRFTDAALRLARTRHHTPDLRRQLMGAIGAAAQGGNPLGS